MEETKERRSLEIDKLYNSTILSVALLVVLVLFMIFLTLLRKKMKVSKERTNRMKRLLSDIYPLRGTEANLDRLLEIVGEMIPAMSYSCYLYDENNDRFVLRAVRKWSDSNAKVGPSYSGLVPYKKEGFRPAMQVEGRSTGEQTELIQEGDLKLLNIGLGGKGVIRIGPIERLPKKLLKEIKDFSQFLSTQMAWLVDNDSFKEKMEIMKFSDEAVQSIMKVTMDPLEMIRNIFESLFYSFDVVAGFFVLEGSKGLQPLFQQGFSTVRFENAIAQNELQSYFQQLGTLNPFTVIDKADPHYDRQPDFLKEQPGVQLFYRCTIQNRLGFLVLFIDENANGQNPINDQVESIKVMTEKLSIYLRFQENTGQVKQIQIEKLKMLAQIVDNKSPYTVGYSDMMSRFSIIVAKELGLSEKTIANIGLAAYLSNIGVNGLSDAILHKEGKYSEEEYEQMKLHVEVGEAIIESTIGDSEVASYIRHHHERMDGNGYPDGLGGEDIPLGSRIIAVIQTFLAKINGRSYREPLGFDQALEVLQSASYAQLDEHIVNIFIEWFQKKRNDPVITSKSLGRCWEMCCVPASICMQCPAYGQHEKNCWEFETNQCKAHGRVCETCFVYTEAKGRATGKISLRSGENRVEL